jgi:hypothetical protein
MVIWKHEVKRGVLYFLRPAFRFILEAGSGGIKDVIDAKLEKGFTMQLTQKYFNVLTKFADEVDKQLITHEIAAGNDMQPRHSRIEVPGTTSIRSEIIIARNMLCTMIDEELYWTPRWHNMLLKIAKEEGLLDPVQEPD